MTKHNLFPKDYESLVLAKKYQLFINPQCRIVRLKYVRTEWGCDYLGTDWDYWITIEYQYRRKNFNLNERDFVKERLVKCRYLTPEEFERIATDKGFKEYVESFCFTEKDSQIPLNIETSYGKAERYESIRVDNSFVLFFNINPKFSPDNDVDYEENLDKIYKLLHASVLDFVVGVDRLRDYSVSYITPGIVATYFDDYISWYEADGESRNAQYRMDAEDALQSGRDEQRSMDEETDGFWRNENDLG